MNFDGLLALSPRAVAGITRRQEWCASAESTGIAALNEFAQQLRGHSIHSTWCPANCRSRSLLTKLSPLSMLMSASE
jgi:hypothetical protein